MTSYVLMTREFFFDTFETFYSAPSYPRGYVILSYESHYIAPSLLSTNKAQLYDLLYDKTTQPPGYDGLSMQRIVENSNSINIKIRLVGEFDDVTGTAGALGHTILRPVYKQKYLHVATPYFTSLKKTTRHGCKHS